MLKQATLTCGAFAVLGLFIAETTGAAVVSVQTHRQRGLVAGRDAKLSPALAATKDADGILKGSDDAGRAVIAVQAETSIAALKTSAAVEKIVEDAPDTWTPVKTLKVSYEGKNRPTDGELKALGVTLIEDYKKGSFMIVEPVDKEIDASLATRLEENDKISYIAPSFNIQAIPPTNVETPAAEPPQVVKPPTTDPLWGNLWGMRNIRAEIAWRVVRDSEVVVAVIDTGVDHKHEDLNKNMWNGPKGTHGYDFVENDADPMDLNGHGTHCAGTVGAVGNNAIGVVGVNWKVQIMALRWMDAGGRGQVADAIKCIDFAVENGAQVLSNSWFWIEDDPDLEAAVVRAEEAGVLFVAAAGNFAQRQNNNNGDNDKPNTYGRIPSAYPQENIIAVAAVNEGEDLAPFSEWGKKSVDLGAPGVLVLSTVPNNRYDGSFSGTSMATPHVAGAAALAIAGGIPSNQVKKQLLGNVRKLDALKDRCVSNGTLDVSFLSKIPAPAPGNRRKERKEPVPNDEAPKD